MKFFDSEDGLDGYIILVEEADLKKPLDLPELKKNLGKTSSGKA